MSPLDIPPEAEEPSPKFLTLIDEFLKTSGSTQGPPSWTLDSRFDQDLGLDSLGRAELSARAEQAFHIRLDDRALLCETPRALLRLIETAAGQAPEEAAVSLSEADGEVPEPYQAETLVQVMEQHARLHAERVHVLLSGEEGANQSLTYGTLWERGSRTARGLMDLGVEPGDRVALMLPTGIEYLSCFTGILLAGAVPVPIYPPTRPSQLEEHLLRHAGILQSAGTRVLITIPRAMGLARLLKTRVPELRHLVTEPQLADGKNPVSPSPGRAEDIAFLQYTSGSTGNPKGVILTHGQLLANIRAMGQAVGASSRDKFVSWLPLYHDMGLIGAWLGSLYYGMPLLLMSPLRFLARPVRWLQAIHRHGATLSGAPNFAYELCTSKIPDDQLEGLDLSSWRYAFNGAEPVSPRTLRAFTQRFEPYGFAPGAMAPVYGLAEVAVGLAFPPAGRGPLIDCVNRSRLGSLGDASPESPSHPDAVELSACGRPLQGYQVQVVDDQGQALPDRREGRLQVQGPSATSGYFNNPEATRDLYREGWLDTGDRAYLADGDIFITGRLKELIIRGGHNIYPYELEQALGELEGIRKGCVAVFAADDARGGTERLVVVAELRNPHRQDLQQLTVRIREVSLSSVGQVPDEILLVPAHTVLKTSSGKIRRAAMREMFDQGRLGTQQRPVWWQVVRLSLSGLNGLLQRSGRRIGPLLYAGYAWILLGLFSAAVWPIVLLLPRLSWRWALIRRAIRGLRALLGIKLKVRGREHLPAKEQPCVLVANHASYLDTLVLIEALPEDLVFAAKGEFLKSFFTRLFLQRLDTCFVDRLDPTRGRDQAETFTRLVRQGHSLGVFPEGTFRRQPGLLPFRMGAFVVAAQAGVPLVPVGIRGTRSVLPADTWLPTRGDFQLDIARPLMPAGDDWEAALHLREEARRAIQGVLEE